MSWRQWPRYTDPRLIIAHCAFVCRGIKLGMQIEKTRIGFQHLKSMRTSLGNYESEAILRRKLNAIPLQKCRGSAPQVDRDIVNLPLNATDNFCLRMRRILKMHTAYRTNGSRHRHIRLANYPIAKRGTKLVLAENP